MANKVYAFYKDLPSWAKGVAVIGGLGITFYIGYTIIRRLKQSAELKSLMQESNYAEDDLRALANKGIRPTLSNSQIKAMINSIIDSVNGCGTDEQRIYDTFSRLNNEADLKLLIKDWGVQSFEPCAIQSPISYTKWLVDHSSIGGTISQILTSELDRSELAQLNSILSKKGINYKF
jgi:hypothetical protein